MASVQMKVDGGNSDEHIESLEIQFDVRALLLKEDAGLTPLYTFFGSRENLVKLIFELEKNENERDILVSLIVEGSEYRPRVR